MAKLAIVKSFTLPLAEVSSLALRTIDGKPQICAIADDSSFIVTAKVSAAGDLGDFERFDMAGIVGADAKNEWEGVAADGEGTLFLLQETGRVLVVAPALDRLLGIIELPPRTGNSGAEGLLLLRNGHVLALNEKNPALLVEYGPPDTVSEGVHPGLFEPAKFHLPSAESSAFVELKSWSVDLEDVSDIAVHDGHLYVVSDASKCIAEIESRLSSDGGEAPIVARWKLPRETKKAEGLLVLEGRTPIVGSDKPDEGEPNVYQLEPLG